MAAAQNVVFNFNVGVLGHVDSGKTSLAKALSTVASTACFDKNPQSKERGITLDLGFSSFCVTVPPHLRSVEDAADGYVQFTLVDCPGHASLIRTVIGGAQIIDMMLLVVDITKGVQTQTAECLIIGEIACHQMIVVVNKIDLIEPVKRAATIDRMTKRLQKTLESTRFAGCPIVAVAAKPSGTEPSPSSESDGKRISDGLTELINTLSSCCYRPERDAQGSFVFAVDHCFCIKGHGTVMTGTVISGSVAVNDTIEIPSMKVTKKVKSIQIFKKPVDSAVQGDRAGLCVTQFDAKQLERGLVCRPGVLPSVSAAIIRVSKISYFKGSVATKAKFHVTIGHETVMGQATFFGRYSDSRTSPTSDKTDMTAAFDFSLEYLYQTELLSVRAKTAEGDTENSGSLPEAQFALMEFEKPVTCGRNFIVIGSKLDTDIHANTCRLAFHGYLLEALPEQNYAETVLPRLRVIKERSKEGVVERQADQFTLICRGLFKKESKVDAFVGLKVSLSTGESGFIEGGFGQSGKFRVRVPAGLGDVTSAILSNKADKKNKNKTVTSESSSTTSPTHAVAEATTTQPIRVLLAFKRNIFDTRKQMLQ